MTQGTVNWKPTKTEIFDQPKGDDGSKFSLAKVAEYVTRGAKDDRVIAWATHKLREAGFPKTTLGRAEALFTALRKQVGWVPDPDATEHMKAPHLLLGDGVDLGYFGAGDCDDLTIALLAAYLSVAQSVGIKAAVVGQSYTRDKAIGHVLGAVWDEKSEKWYYMDPSSDFALGECLTPFTRERIIQVPSQKVICDADVCLSSPRSVRPVPPTDGFFIGVMGLPNGEEEIVFFDPPAALGEFKPHASGDGLSAALAFDPANVIPMPDSFELGLGKGLLGASLQLLAGIADMEAARDVLVKKMGAENLFKGPVWTPDLESLFNEVKGAASVAAQFLDEAAHGQRAIAPGEGDDLVLEGKETDPFWIKLLPKKPSDIVQMFELVNPLTGQAMSLSGLDALDNLPIPNRHQRNAMATRASQALGVAPAAAAVPLAPLIVAVVGSVCIVIAAVYAITNVTQVIHATVQQAIAAWNDKNIIDCIKEKGKLNCPSPDELADAYRVKRKADADLLKANEEASPWVTALKWGAVGGGVIALSLAAREYFKGKKP